MFNNEHGSPAFEEFLDFLGEKIPLKGWFGYRGDLDVKTDTTGKFSVYRRWKGFEIMFHVSTLLLYSPGQEQQLHRKRRIGNDIGVIIFQEGEAYTPPIRSQFLSAYTVVSPYKGKEIELETYYRVEVTAQEAVPPYGPDIQSPGIFPKNHDFRDLLLTKVVNGNLSSLNHPALSSRIWVKPKEAFMLDLTKSFCKSKSILQSLEIPS